MLRTPLSRLLQGLSLWLVILSIGCGGGGGTTVVPDPNGPDPDTNGGLPGPTPDTPGGGGGGTIPTTPEDIRSGTTDGNGRVTLPAFAKAAASSRAGKAVSFQLADQAGAPLSNVLVVNVRSGNEFVGAIVPPDASRAPRFFFSQRIPDRVLTGDEDRAAAISTGSFGEPVSSALNIAVEGNTIIVKLDLETDAAVNADTGIGTRARYFIDNDLLNRVLGFSQFASYSGVFNQAQLGNAVADALDDGGGYFYLAGLVEGSNQLSNWQLGANLELTPGDPTFQKFLTALSTGGTLNTYFLQQLAVGDNASRATIRSAFDTEFGAGPIPANLTSAQRYLLIKVRPTDVVAGYQGNNQNVLIAVPIAPRTLALNGANATNKFVVNTTTALSVIADYAAGSSLAITPNATATECLSGRIALTMTPLRPGDVLTRPGASPSIKAVDELQRNLQADYFIPDYFGDPTAYPQGQLGTGCTSCISSSVFPMVGPNGSITNLLPTAKVNLITPITGTGRLVGGQLAVTVSGTGSSDPDSNIVKLEINWGDNEPDTVITGTPVDVNNTINHTYNRAGTFQIQLKITDDGIPAASSTATVSVTAVANANPVLCLTSATPEIINGEVHGTSTFRPKFVFDCSSDADSDIFATGTVTIVFGDGPVLTNEPFVNYKTIEKPYSTPGEYTMVMTLKDIDGGTDIFTVRIIVEAPPVNQPPVAMITPDVTMGEAPLTVNFSSAGSDDPDGFINSYLWNFGDPAITGGGVSIAPDASYTYSQADVIGDGFTVKLIVIDNLSAMGQTTTVIHVTQPANIAPIAEITAPSVAEVGQLLQFDSSGSSDPDGNNLVSFMWDFGDGNTSTLPNPTHTYTSVPKGDNYFISLTVTDDGTPVRMNTAFGMVQILSGFNPAEPFSIIVPGGPTAIEGTGTVTFDGSQSFSPVGSAIESYEWFFQDDSSMQTGASVMHEFLGTGNFAVILTVTDDMGRTSSSAIPVYVLDTSPFGLGVRVVGQVSANVREANIGDPVQFFTTGTHDPEGDPIQIIGWEFGDGTNSTSISPTHMYTQTGIYQVKMVASEFLPSPDPTRFVETNLLIHVTNVVAVNVPPVGLSSSDIKFAGSAPATFNFDSIYVFDPDDILNDSSVTWDFGDGSSDMGMSVTHEYADPGFYEVTMSILDSHGDGSNANYFVYVASTAKNVPPLIDILSVTGSLVGEVGTPFELSFAGSEDFEGEMITYTTDFGERGADPVDGEMPAYAYTEAGKYTISVLATDEAFNVTNRYFDVLIAPAP